MGTKKKTTAKKLAAKKTSRAKKVPFTKMQGIGNDVLIIDCTKSTAHATNPSHLAKKLCNRHTGIGADQLMVLSKSRKYDYAVKTFNADGSEAEVCGNGLRCLAKYVREMKYTTKKEIVFETVVGPRETKVSSKAIEVDMGEPIMKGKDIPVNLSGRVVNRPLKMEAKDFRVTCLSVGNPHCIIFQDNLADFNLERFGPMIENHNVFPKKANVSFVNILSKNDAEVRVWERGAGETLGCGSAASAVCVAGVLNGFTDRKIKIQMPGGKLEVEWSTKNNHIYLKGPAEIICKGEALV